jgi:hypothetical protein
LKPDVCRRVVGRLPSPGSKSRDGATIQLLALLREFEDHGGLSCEIARTYARIRSLTTGTFNLVVKDRIAVRRSGANSVQANPLLERIRLSSKPYKHTVRRKILSMSASHRISRCFPHRKSRAGKRRRRALRENQKPVIPNGKSPRGTCFLTLARSCKQRATVWPSA